MILQEVVKIKINKIIIENVKEVLKFKDSWLVDDGRICHPVSDNQLLPIIAKIRKFRSSLPADDRPIWGYDNFDEFGKYSFEKDMQAIDYLQTKKEKRIYTKVPQIQDWKLWISEYEKLNDEDALAYISDTLNLMKETSCQKNWFKI